MTKPATLVALALLVTVEVSAQTELPRFDRVVHVSSDRVDVPHAEPHLSVDPSDPSHLLVSSIVLPEGEAAVLEVLFSRDGGETWRRQSLPSMDGHWAADPWTAIDLDGRPALSALVPMPGQAVATAPWLVWLYRAEGVGEPWGAPTTVGLGDGGAWDQQKIAFDRTGGAHHGRMYISGDKWGPRNDRGQSAAAVGWAVLERGAATPKEPIHLANNNVSKSPSAPVVLGDGSVIVAFHEYIPLAGDAQGGWLGGLWTVWSPDGLTFEPRNFVAKDLRPGMIALAADSRPGADERLFVVWPSTSGALHAAHSLDRAHRWSSPVRLGPLPEGEIVGVAAAVDGTGRAGVLWSRGVPTDVGFCQEVFFSWSTGGGETYSPQASLLDGPSCVSLADGPTFLVGDAEWETYDRYKQGGEYFGLVGFPDGGFYAVWVDATTGEYQLKGRRIR